MTPFDSYQGWVYDREEQDPTDPSMRNTRVSSPGNRYIDPTDVIPHSPIVPPTSRAYTTPDKDKNPFPPTPPRDKGKRVERRFGPLFWFFSMVAVLALCIGFFVNALGVQTMVGQALQAVIRHPMSSTRQKQTPLQGTRPVGRQRPTVPALSQTLPPQWATSGQTVATAGDAEVIAHGFVERYNSIEASTPQSLATSLVQAQLFLTPNAQLRFHGQVAGVLPDPHVTPQFVQQFQMGPGNQLAIVSEQAITNALPQMQPPQFVNGNFYAIVTVPYQQTITFQNGTTQSTQQQMTVALIAVPKNGKSVPNSMGWAISAFVEGNTIPPLPTQP